MSPRPAIAPRKSRTALALTEPLYRLYWKKTGKLSSDSRYTPIPSTPPSPLLPVTVALTNPASLRSRRASLSSGGYEFILGRHLLPRWGGRKVGSITHEAVQRWVAELGAGGLAPGTVRGVLSAVVLSAGRDRYGHLSPSADAALAAALDAHAPAPAAAEVVALS